MFCNVTPYTFSIAKIWLVVQLYELPTLAPDRLFRCLKLLSFLKKSSAIEYTWCKNLKEPFYPNDTEIYARTSCSYVVETGRLLFSRTLKPGEERTFQWP